MKLLNYKDLKLILAGMTDSRIDAGTVKLIKFYRTWRMHFHLTDVFVIVCQTLVVELAACSSRPPKLRFNGCKKQFLQKVISCEYDLFTSLQHRNCMKNMSNTQTEPGTSP